MDNYDWLWLLLRLLISVLILTFALVIMGFLTYFERKVAAHMQQRQGPNRTGPIGLLQWVADAIKLMSKEDVFPAGVDKAVFAIAPIISMFTATASFAFLPFGENIYIGDRPFPWYISETPISLIAYLALSGLGVYGIIMGAWSSNSKYPILGGLRAAAQVISYEIILGISLVGVMLLSQSFNLNDIARAQGGSLVGTASPPGTPGIWFILLQPVAFLMYTIGAFAETNRTPFDLPESESELVSGYHVEFSGMRFGSFFLAEYINMIVVSAVATYAFLGGWQPLIPFGFLGSAAFAPVWFIFKMALFIFFFYWVRWTLPRIRFDQLMGLCWKVFLPIVLLNILVIAILRAFIPYNEPQFSFTNNLFSPWLIIVAVQLVFFVVLLVALSRASAGSWFGKSEKPVNVSADRILPAPGAAAAAEGARRIELKQGL